MTLTQPSASQSERVVLLIALRPDAVRARPDVVRAHYRTLASLPSGRLARRDEHMCKKLLYGLLVDQPVSDAHASRSAAQPVLCTARAAERCLAVKMNM